MTRGPSPDAPADNVVPLTKAFDAPDKKISGRKKPAAPKSGGGEPPKDPPPRPKTPDRLPQDCPVTALGTMDGFYFYTDALGQVRRQKETEHGRLHILSLFGGKEYLSSVWPVWSQDKFGEWHKKDDFNHGAIAPVMMSSCHDEGIFDPANRVRGCGAWAEDDGALVLHCGRYLWRTQGGSVVRDEPGLRDGLLYPRRPALPEPVFDELDDPGPRLLDMLETWNWKRGRLDAQIVLGWMVAALLGQAPPWRPMLWVTGGKGTGKSTIRQLLEWTLGKQALIAPENTSQAYVYQTIGDSALPVALDEFEAKEDNRRVQDVIDLMRIAASGGTLGRGGSENNPKSYTLKSCFVALSILMPPLNAQDLSRMAICELRKLHRKDDQPELDLNAADDEDMVLGSKVRWAKTGAQLRGRVLTQWPRYLKTFKAYFQALMLAGHEHRAASQFGALGAGYDLAMYDSLVEENVLAWARLLPAADLAETKGYVSEPEGCLQHLLASTPDIVRKGTHETIAHYLRTAKSDVENDKRSNDPDDASRILAKIGMRVYRDPDLKTANEQGELVPVWWVAIASTHPALGEIFKGTHWKGRAGAPGTWAQALRGIDGAAEKAIQMRIDDGKWWVTRLMFDAVIQPFNEHEDRDEIEAVSIGDRRMTAKEKRGGKQT